MRRVLAPLLFAVSVSGCYHATVRTGIPSPSARTESKWAHSWVYGLVPPSTVDAADVCEGRPAAVVSTQMSAANYLVGVLTGGIYTPMTIEVTCAQ